MKSLATGVVNFFGTDTIHRPLQGQAPYIYNAGLYYENAGSGTRISLVFNRVGTRIYAADIGSKPAPAGGGANNYGYEGSLLELPRNQMDFSLTQRIVKTLQLKFSIQNLLNVPVEMAQDDNFDFKYEPEHLNKGIGSQFTDQGDNIYSRFNPDRYYVLSVTYSF